jgi:hypothetical protein
MAKYMLLIYGDAAQGDAMTPEQAKAHDAEFIRATAGRVTGGEKLTPAPLATAVRAGSHGGVVLTDGPFRETKEAVGGFYLIEAADLDEVVKLVALLPEVKTAHSGVEIRPVVDHG